MHSELVFLPPGAVAPELREEYERKLAVEQVKEMMQDVRDYLEQGQGSRKEMQARLYNMKEKYPGLQFYQTENFFNQYDIDQAPELEKLKAAYRKWFADVNFYEGRQNTDKAFSEDSFYRLFFDASEVHSVASKGPFVIQEWPPEVEIPARPLFALQERLESLPGLSEAREGGKQFDLWGLFAERPILFWKAELKEAVHPEQLADVKDRVVRAWKFQTAREKFALPRAEEIARLVIKQQTAELDFMTDLAVAAKDLGVELLPLPGVAKLVPNPGTQVGTTYEPYKLPRDLIPYPRKDMAEQVLALYNLKEPLTTKEKAPDEADPTPRDAKLDEVNKGLFQQKWVGKKERQVQILTNRPRTVYYVAVVTGENPPERDDFFEAYVRAQGMQGGSDEFVSLAWEQASQEHREAVLQQLRKAADQEIKNAQGFDN